LIDKGGRKGCFTGQEYREKKGEREREGESHQREMHLGEVAREITAGKRSPEGG
jgi:hypothetical protein